MKRKRKMGIFFFSLSSLIVCILLLLLYPQRMKGMVAGPGWLAFGIEGKMAMTCEEKIAKPKVLQKCDVMGFGVLEIASEVQAVTDSLCVY